MVKEFKTFSANTLLSVKQRENYFQDWDSFAAVRSKKNTYRLNFDLLTTELKNKNWFIPEGVKILTHPELSNINNDQTQYLMGRFLLQFLEYGVLMEHEYVNNITAELALGELGFNLPESMRLDAFKIYTDEGYHALITLEAAQYIREYIKLPNCAWPLKNSRLDGLRKLISDAPEEDRMLIRLGIVGVSETVAAKELAEAMKNVVIDPIANLFIDHARDEARHCVYFSVLWEVIWEQLTKNEQLKLGKYLPKILKAFVIINTYPLLDALDEIGIKNEKAERIIRDSYPMDFAVKRVMGASLATFAVFKKLKLFNSPEIKSAFINEGFPIDALQ